MVKQETRKQHFVPAGYLRRFVEPDQEVGVARKEDLSHIWPQAAETLCVEKHIYTLSGETEEERQEIENEYEKRWESQYDTVYKLLTADAVKRISDETRRLIIETITSMLFRNRRMKETFEKSPIRIFENAVAHHKARPADVLTDDDGEVIDVGDKDAAALMREYWQKNKDRRIRALFRIAIEVAGVRLDDHIQVVKVEGDRRFITSDNPVYVVPEGGMLSGPTNKDLSLSLPINGSYRSELYPKRFGRDSNRISRLSHSGAFSATEVLMANREQMEQASLFVIGTEENIRQYDALLKDPARVHRYEAERDVFIHELCRKFPKLCAQYGYVLPDPVEEE